MPSLTSGFRYWRSLDDLVQAPEFLEMVSREFPGETWDALEPATRRSFLKVMAASLGLAGLAGCRWPSEEIVPFAYRADGRSPGVPERFATAFEHTGVALGMVVTSFDGRPVKAEGNPNHPDSLGALPAVAQASVLGLYDPDRSRSVVRRGSGQEVPSSWDDFERFARDHFEALRAAGGQGLAVLAGACSSPTLARLRRRLVEGMPQAAWFEWEPLTRDAERDGARLAFGRPLRVDPHLDRCRVVACFDADPLGEHPASTRLARELAEARRPETGHMARLWVAEPFPTLTGAMADHRRAVSLSGTASVLVALARALEGLGVAVASGGVLAGVGGAGGSDEAFVADLADDLAANRGQGVILVGPRQPAEVHALALVLNRALGNVGATLSLLEDPDPSRPSHLAGLADLADRLRAGRVETLLVLASNPVLTAPADLGFAALLDGVPTTIHLGLHRDETGRRCSWHLPEAHGLEAWGDGNAWDGTHTLVQPLIAPLHGGRSAVEVVALLVEGQPVSGRDLVRAELLERYRPLDPEAAWRGALHDGVVADSAWAEVRPDLDPTGLGQLAVGLSALVAVPEPGPERLELVFVGDAKVHDGRFANNAWLQELPEPLTKITWDNALLVAPPTARQLGLEDGDVVGVDAGSASVELPLYVVPGAAPFCLQASLGYGRSAAGRVGDAVGVDVYPLRTSTSPHSSAVTVRRTGRRVQLATTQDHHAIDALGFEARNTRIGTLVREATFEELRHEPEVIQHQGHHLPLIQLWEAHAYEGEQWGMAVDLNACTGCNACVVACQAENNIPVVGREQVGRQREMQWIRVDRYFRTPQGQRPEEVDQAEVVFQPVACVHCENAPCEQVCPVAATQHTRDGLNAMAYNRCVGTRYCSNNCPYKVRRFNFFNYREHLDRLEALQLNPDVTVRSRGVMEKCTYCVQRIEAVRIRARNERRPIADGEVVPACAQTCPTRAITFGNLNDPASAISRLRDDHRAYAMLSELNVRPRTIYLARLRNPVGDHGKEAS